MRKSMPRDKHKTKQTSQNYRLKNWQKILYLAANRKRKNKTNKIVDIDEDWIKLQFINQKKKCYWTNVTLEPSIFPKHPLKPSLDRINNKLGYTKENTVITALSVNLGRNENDKECLIDFLQQIKKCY